jgi:glutamate/tyrosine decarboxylase-like PLP-dependent enzyme
VATRKRGYGPKGASVVLYRSRALRHYQYFAMTDWAGGYYASPTLAGSRSGGIAAATWAAMVALGEEGYLEIACQIMKAAETIRAGAASIPEIKIAGRPTFCMAFMSDVVDIYHASDQPLSDHCAGTEFEEINLSWVHDKIVVGIARDSSREIALPRSPRIDLSFLPALTHPAVTRDLGTP